jgi:hypothetical protein
MGVHRRLDKSRKKRLNKVEVEGDVRLIGWFAM